METYCVSCKKNTTSKYSSVRRTKQNTLMLLSEYAICSKEKSIFIKTQEASELLSKLRIKTPSSNIPLIGDVLIQGTCFVSLIFEMISLK